MKKLLFLLAGACIALTASAQTPATAGPAGDGAAISTGTVIVKAGFCPEYYEGYLCGIFVTIEKDRYDGKILRLVDPQPHVYQIRSDNDWVEITDKVLIGYDVRYNAAEEGDMGKGVLHCSFTYQYPGGTVQNYSIAIESYPGM